MKIQFIFSILLIFLIYLGLNSYVVLRLGWLLDIKKNILYIITVLATVSLPLAMYFDRIFHNLFSKTFYTIATMWLGIFMFLLILLLVYEVIRQFYNISYIGWIIISLASFLVIISVINASRLTVRELEISVDNLERELTIVQLSDIHIGTIRNTKFLNQIIEKTNQLKPDIVMITGDLVDGSARLEQNMFSVFNDLPAPVYFVTGNHEMYEGIDKVYELLKNSKIRVLKNELVDFRDIQIIGVEFSENKDHLKTVLESLTIDNTKPTILMYHYPKDLEEAQRAGINLQLSGHTHNGQIMPFNFLVRLQFKYVTGLHLINDMYLYISPGTGTWGPYMRLGSSNEISYLRLLPK